MADTWEVISGYSATNYVDTMTFEVDAETKKLAKLSGQTLVAGEKNSQYIRIKMPRYWDGIDISEMNIGIIYDLNNGEYFGTTQAISAERTTDSIRFGWVVPGDACAVKGTLLFVIIVKGTNYILKTQIAETPVVKSLSEDGDIPEPTREIWYENFRVRVETAVSDAENAISEAKIILEQARSFVGSPLVAETAAAMVDTERIYVYTGSESGYTSGNWYYYNTGTSAWTSGGVYNAVAVDTDTTLTIAGKAADAKKTGDEIGELKSGLSEVKGDLTITLPTLSLTSGQYINASGAKSNGNSFSYSAPIAVSAGQRVLLHAAGYSTNVSMISVCDSNGDNIVPRVISVDADVHDYIYDVLENGYVLFSFHHGKDHFAKIYGTQAPVVLFRDITEIVHSIRNDLSKTIIDTDTFEQGVWKNGAKAASSFTIRGKDGYAFSKYSTVYIVPNGQYVGINVWKNRTESEGNITFSDSIYNVDWQNTAVSFDVPADCWMTFAVRKTYPSNTTIGPRDNLVQIYVVDNQISQNKGDIIALDTRIKTLEKTIPNYWETEYARVKDAINSNRLIIGNKIAEFFFITDIHWNGNAKKSPMLINALSKDVGINNVLCGGDVIFTHDTTQLGAVNELQDFYKQFAPNVRLFSTIGNHDLNSNNNSDSSTYLTANQLYPLMMSNEESYTDTGATPYVTVYDNESQKVRYIQFYHPDTVPIPQDAQTTVINAIKEKGTDWTVVIMCHVYWSTGNAVDTYINAFAKQLAEINASGSYATIAALLVGHMHYDSSVVVDDGLLVIATICDIYRQSSGATMTVGTDTEQAFDVVQIDTTAKKIYMTRVGAGSDREFSY